MQVIIKKMHETFLKDFPVGTEHELSRRFKHCKIGIQSSVTGKIFNADALTGAISNRCSYADLFTKVNPNEILL